MLFVSSTKIFRVSDVDKIFVFIVKDVDIMEFDHDVVRYHAVPDCGTFFFCMACKAQYCALLRG